jgi:CheY-like chemotaxis protein
VRILYVEDNTTNVILVQRVANMGKHEVVNYDDGQDALDKFDQAKPDLILLDVQLRGPLTGLDVARTLREKGCVLPIIAVTAYAMKGDRQLCLDAGCDDYLPKPISVSELVTVFKRYGEAVAAGKPILSTTQPKPLAPEASAVPAPTPAPALAQPLVEITPVVASVPVEVARLSEPVPDVLPTPTPAPAQPIVEITPVVASTQAPVEAVSAVTVVEPPTASPPSEPVPQRTPAPVSAEP